MKLSVFFQRVEAAILLVAMVASYRYHNYPWMLFIFGLLAVDLSMLGYAVNSRVGAIIYNLGHTLIGPLILLALSVTGYPELDKFATIWIAHIGLDRAMGLGLKEVDGFRHTHLGHIGKKR
jgi:hypothetical protein